MAKINTRPSTDAFEGGDINFKRPSQAKEIIRRLKKNRGAIVGLILLILIILVVIFADVIAPMTPALFRLLIISWLLRGPRDIRWAAIALAAMSYRVWYTAPATR